MQGFEIVQNQERKLQNLQARCNLAQVLDISRIKVTIPGSRIRIRIRIKVFKYFNPKNRF